MTKKRRIFSNFVGFSSIVTENQAGEYIDLNKESDGWSAWRIIRSVRPGDVVILNVDHTRLYKLCVLRIFFFWKPFRLVSVDILLRTPARRSGRLFLRKLFRHIQRILLQRVDLFILYFRDTSGYQQLFGLRPERIRYVPFKVNGWEEGLDGYQADPASGDYVICAGMTLRDLTTFVEACRLVDVPAVLLSPGNELYQRHGTQLDGQPLPPNVRMEIHDDGKPATYIEWLKGAAIVVIPRFKQDISSSGIGTYLAAMAASRCVILSKGPGAEDVLVDGQAVLVDPEDAEQLANALETFWNNSQRRAEVALRGRKYAEQLRGERRLFRDVLKVALEG